MCVTSSSKFLTALAAAFSFSMGGCTPEAEDPVADNGSPPPAPKEVTLTWNAPTSRTDGSCLNGALAGFDVSYVGEHTNSRDEARLSMNDGALACEQTDYDSACDAIAYSCSYTVEELEPDTWEFVVQAYDENDLISADSGSLILNVE